jgi:hypothetical protein
VTESVITAPTDDQEPPTVPETPPDGQTDDTPAWKRASTREEALAALLDDEELPIDALTRHQRVSGIIGTHAQRQARDIAAERERAATEQRRRQQAASGDYTSLGADVAAEYAPDPAAEMRRSTQNELTQDAQKALGALLATLPDESQKELSERANNGAYKGGFGEGLSAWVSDMVEQKVKAELQSAVAKEIRRRGLVPSAVAESDRVETEGSPDVSAGSRAASAPNWATEEEMSAALAEGLMSGDPTARQQMVTWYRRPRR